MKWIIQNNIFNEANYDKILDTLKRLDFEYTEVKVVPFIHTLEPEPVIDTQVVCYGSTGLTKISMQRGWKPGVFF